MPTTQPASSLPRALPAQGPDVWNPAGNARVPDRSGCQAGYRGLFGLAQSLSEKVAIR